MTVHCAETDKAYELLCAALSDQHVLEKSERSVHIHHYQDGEAVNRLLVGSGIYASEIKQHKMDLEEYFLSAMEGRTYA